MWIRGMTPAYRPTVADMRGLEARDMADRQWMSFMAEAVKMTAETPPVVVATNRRG